MCQHFWVKNIEWKTNPTRQIGIFFLASFFQINAKSLGALKINVSHSDIKGAIKWPKKGQKSSPKQTSNCLVFPLFHNFTESIYASVSLGSKKIQNSSVQFNWQFATIFLDNHLSSLSLSCWSSLFLEKRIPAYFSNGPRPPPPNASAA